jgi:hypothetical protein
MARTAARPNYPQTARRHYLLSSLVARRAAREARKATSRGPTAVASVIVAHQITQARISEVSVGQMLAEQGIDAAAEATLNLLSFSTELQRIEAMLTKTLEQDVERLAASLVQDAGRAAESVATAVRPRIGYVRYLNLPSCSRCAVLAGRVYRWSSGFERHPNCDCTMVPTTVANDSLIQDPADLLDQGQVMGMSKADAQAVAQGADFAKVVNVRLRKAGLREAGRVLGRRGTPTPEGIYRMASDQTEAVALLRRYGYIT